ncbi:MAG: aminotransferase class V-fold PLP-dependent enzyme [Clostridia bacterium]
MIYLDNAATSKFKPKCALKAFEREFLDSANGGRSGHRDAVNTALRISLARTFLCNIFNGNEIIFTKNCTEALNIVILGSLKEGGHVITTVNEHNSVLRPLFKLERDKKIKLSVINPDTNLAINPNHLERLIGRDTYMVVVNAASNVTGAQADLEKIGKICAEKNIMLVVDGAQAVPHASIDVKALHINYLACPGHKGLHGPQGTGFLVLNDERKLQPLLYGGTGTNSDSVYQPFALPEALEAGTLNAAGIYSLGEASKWTYKNISKIRRHIESINETVLYGLKNMNSLEVYTPDGTKNGVVAFNIKNKTSMEVGDILNEKYNIAVRSGLHCAPLIHNHLGTLDRGIVRASIGFNNTEKDAYCLLKAVEEIIANK